jgi:DoxX-like family
MPVASTILSSLLAAVLAFSAIRKLSHDEGVVRTYVRAGLPEAWLDRLALILLAGAAGLIAGVFWAPLGIAAAFAVACYFAVAVAFHLRAGDAEHLPTPALLALIAAVALGLRLASA